MKQVRRAIPLLLGWVVVLILLTGCYMPAAPDVTPTPSQQEIEEAGMATLAAQAAQETPTSLPLEFPTETPTLMPPEEETPSPTPEFIVPTVPPAETPTAPVETTPTEMVPPQPTMAQPMGEVAAAPAGAETTYIVQPGDRLFRIALRFGVDYRTLASYNNIFNPDLIYPGQVLRIPGTGQPPTQHEILYTVQPGDNLFRIALRYNMNYLYLASYNGIENPHQIRVGQVIRIPVIP